MSTLTQRACCDETKSPHSTLLGREPGARRDALERALQEALAYLRTGAGAAIVHATCVRIGSHSNSDKHELYRSPEELAEARAKDQGRSRSRPSAEEAGPTASDAVAAPRVLVAR